MNNPLRSPMLHTMRKTNFPSMNGEAAQRGSEFVARWGARNEL
jgi:hypothetical protein